MSKKIVVIKHHFGCVKGSVGNIPESGFIEFMVVNEKCIFWKKLDIECGRLGEGGGVRGEILEENVRKWLLIMILIRLVHFGIKMSIIFF